MKQAEKFLVSIFFSLICCFQVEDAFAQKSFYIRPWFESKTSFGSTNWQKNSFKDNPYQGDAPFVLQNKDVMWQHNLSPIHLGIGFGYEFPNEKMSVEFNVSQDGSKSGYQLFFNGYDSTFGYSSGVLESHAGISFTRFSLQVTTKLFETEKSVLSIHLIGGLSYGITKKGDPLKNLIPEQTTFQIEPSTSLDLNSGLYLLNQKVFLWQLGLAGRVNLIKEGEEKFELFTFSIYYIHGERPFSVKPVTIHVVENQNQMGTYNFNSYGYGSGLNFQISRKIHFSFGKK
ncbi:MAG: hypothetical protein IPM74_07430 [Crocinitomicaceae bacterium]|nr:hypothetical protein [Crocinitomicaceae bacterium]MBK8925731.1 hypothetical protein [Crocinitomicaceae bacterium]